jgi:hypothetical protein
MEIDSRALRGVRVIVGRSIWLGDTVVVDRPALPLTERRFRFESAEETLEFEGYTFDQPPYREPDVWTPSLDLDGQRFFDRAHGKEATDALLLVGGPPAPLPRGAVGRFARVASGPRQGEAVRPFALQGADRPLGEAVQRLVGWRDRPAPEVIDQAVDAGHPLIALDALRICTDLECRAGGYQRLARRLLHPSEPPEARAIALGVVGRKLRKLRAGSEEANALVELTWRAWQRERQHPVAEKCLEAWVGAPEQIQKFPASRELIAMALDETAAERRRGLRRRLREAVQAGDGNA